MKSNRWQIIIILSALLSFNHLFAQELTKEEMAAQANAKVLSLNLSGKKDISVILPTLHTYVNLQSLDLSGSFIQNEDLALIHNPKLSFLSVANTIINSDGIAYIGRLSQLRSLNMEGTFINDSALPMIAKLNSLTNVTDNGIKSLKNSRISRLDLTSLKITDEGMKTIGTMENLRELHLWNTKIAAVDLNSFQSLKSLTVLTLAGTEIGNEGVRYISKLPSLKSLNLSWTKITDLALESFRGNQTIEVLSLSGTKITQKGIGYLSKMKNLKILVLEDVLINDEYEDTLAEFPRLKVIYLSRVSYSEKALKSLVKRIPWTAVYYEGILQFSED